jgi:uncharacterized phage protein gp47/JayE
MLKNTSNDVYKSEGSLTYDAHSPASNEFAQTYITLDQVVNKFDLSNLSGDELATRIYQRTGLTKNLATYSVGVLNIIGTATIAIGDLFQTPNLVQFKSLENKTIVANGTISIQALVAGSSGNIPAGQITGIPVTITGLISVTNPLPTENGFDVESDSALLQRYYEKIQLPSTQGNIAQFIILAKAYTGVGAVKVFPTWHGNNTIKLVIIDANKQPPSTDFINAVQTYMDPLGDNWGLGYGAAPAFSFTTIAGATANTINVSFTAVKDSNYTDAQRLTNVQTSIIAYLKSIAFVASSVSYAQIGAAILSSSGILDYSNLTVNGGTSNISISFTTSLCEVPVLGVVNIV